MKVVEAVVAELKVDPLYSAGGTEQNHKRPVILPRFELKTFQIKVKELPFQCICNAKQDGTLGKEMTNIYAR